MYYLVMVLKRFIMIEKVDFLLRLYLYKLTNCSLNLGELQEINYQSDEANLDEDLKLRFKNIIEKDPHILMKELNTYKVQYHKSEFTFGKDDLCSFKVEKVYLPNEIPESISNKLKERNKSNVFTNPDLLLELSFLDKSYFRSIELKSTKNDIIPGSSVQQIHEEILSVFVKHNKTVEITSGFYLDAVSGNTPFPDRSPRPKVSFNQLAKTNKCYVDENDGVITVKVLHKKDKNLQNWHLKLVKDWIGSLSKSNSSKWFDDVIVKYTYHILKQYDKMTIDEQKDSLEHLRERYNKTID